MARPTKPVVSKEDTFDRLEIRLGRVIEVADAVGTPKPAFRLRIDFGKFGQRTSVGRFSMHAKEDLQNRLVVGVLNFEPRNVGDTLSEVLILGVQFPKAASGEATPLIPLSDARIGGKLF